MSLVRSGVFESPEQFLEVAARNQLVYELGARPDLRASDASLPATTNGGNDGDVRPSRYGVAESPRRSSAKQSQPQDWAALFRIEVRPSPTPPPASPTESVSKQRIWGQVNRILPIKLATRFVLNCSTGKEDWPQLSDVLKPLGGAAAALGTHLEILDARAARKRDELLATGLPRVANEASWERFVTQFVARMTRDGKVYPGAICQFPLAVIKDGRLALTGLGIDFAKARNPILDRGEVESTLSDDEREFFVARVIAWVPAELHDFKTTIAAVQEGNTSPEALTAALANAIRSEDSATNWTEVMMRTHVSGVVSRMVDLGLLRRRWEGRRVSYEIPPQGVTIPEGKEEVQNA
jgi:hypothetical protein